jgi:hypothetical protein
VNGKWVKAKPVEVAMALDNEKLRKLAAEGNFDEEKALIQEALDRAKAQASALSAEKHRQHAIDGCHNGIVDISWACKEGIASLGECFCGGVWGAASVVGSIPGGVYSMAPHQQTVNDVVCCIPNAACAVVEGTGRLVIDTTCNSFTRVHRAGAAFVAPIHRPQVIEVEQVFLECPVSRVKFNKPANFMPGQKEFKCPYSGAVLNHGVDSADVVDKSKAYARQRI